MNGSIRLLRINGDMKESPLIDVARRLHKYFSELSVPYAVVGGLAVVRNGAPRTTQDVDILTTRKGWRTVCEMIDKRHEEFDAFPDHAREQKYGIDIDVLFPGDDWEMVVSVPVPEAVREYDSDYGLWFIDLHHLLELKTAVYLKKRDEDGIEIAAKDLADIVYLLQANRDKINEDALRRFPLSIRKTLREIMRKVL